MQPFRAGGDKCHANPGRCPGLSYCAPLGLTDNRALTCWIATLAFVWSMNPSRADEGPAPLSPAEVQSWLHEFRDVKLPNDFQDFLDPPAPDD